MITFEKITKQIHNQKSFKAIDKKAAVLVPIIDINNELHLLFQIRSKKLKWQPGDICFPGGRIEKVDKSPEHTAIRETQEELGITPNDIIILGQLPKFNATLGIIIYPFIAKLNSLNNLQLNTDEVEKIFTVPIKWFINNPPQVATMKTGHKPSNNFPFELIPNISKKWQKRSEYQVFLYSYHEYTIWGLTAQIIHDFIKVIS